ncbi:MAG: archaetidylserine decarboxylase [bacterium]
MFFRLYSWVVKAVADIHIPYKMRIFLFRTLGKHLFGMTESDFGLINVPLSSFKTLNEFFTRQVDLKKRPIHFNELISPCEGKVIEYGLVKEGDRLIQAKGISYSLNRLVLSDKVSSNFKEGSFCNIYLSPRNYHRFHSPCSGTIDYVQHICGACYPVNEAGQTIPGLYTLNERYIVSIVNPQFRICLAIIGATAVRGIKLFKKEGDTLIKGEMLGMFQMGSSIIVLSSKKVFTAPNVPLGEVKVLGPILK